MSELTDRGANRAVAIALQRDNAALRQEIERLTAERDEATRQLHVEQLLNTNGHRQLEDVKIALVQAEQERDEALSMRDFAKEDRDLYYQRWEAVSRERDAAHALLEAMTRCNHDNFEAYKQAKAALARVERERDQLQNDQMYQRVIERMEQAEQREARLREALDKAINTQRCFADEWRRLMEMERVQESEYALFVLNQFKHQALSQLSTDLTDQSEAVHKKEPSGSPD